MVKTEPGKLIWKTNGETVVIESWGENALRVRAVMQGEITETGYALPPQEPLPCRTETGDGFAKITNGKLTARTSWPPAAGGRITAGLPSSTSSASRSWATSTSRTDRAITRACSAPSARTPG